MKIRVLLFGLAAESAAADHVEIDMVATSATVADLRRALAEQQPTLARLAPTCAVAVNHAYKPPRHPVVEGDEVALIPPVSGG